MARVVIPTETPVPVDDVPEVMMQATGDLVDWQLVWAAIVCFIMAGALLGMLLYVVCTNPMRARPQQTSRYVARRPMSFDDEDDDGKFD